MNGDTIHDLIAEKIMNSEISQAVREVHAAIVASVTTAAMAAHGTH